MGSDYHRWRTRPHPNDFNPRSPDGERRAETFDRDTVFEFQSTLPGWGATIWSAAQCRDEGLFQSTLPGWGATLRHYADALADKISIHAPRMGSDRENGHLRPRYGQNHPFSTLIVSQIVVDVLGTVRKSQKTPAH